MTDELTEADIRTMPVKEAPDLSPMEKETVLTMPTDMDMALFSSEVSTTIKWFLSIEESVIEDYQTEGGAVVAVKGRVPKGNIKLQGSARKSNVESQMVSYGDER
jgi:hypothetical protein